MALDNDWVFSLTKDLKQVIVSNEVESGEDRSLLLKEIIKSFLAHVKLSQDSFQSILKPWDFTETDYFRVGSNTKHNASVLFVDSLESALLLGKCTSHEDGLKIHPLSLNDVELRQVFIDPT